MMLSLRLLILVDDLPQSWRHPPNVSRDTTAFGNHLVSGAQTSTTYGFQASERNVENVIIGRTVTIVYLCAQALLFLLSLTFIMMLACFYFAVRG